MYKIRKITVVILVIAMVLLCMNIMAQHSFASRKLSKAQIKRLEFMVQTIGSQMNQYSSIIVEKYDENRELDIDFYRSTLFFYLFENDGIGKRLGKNIVVPKRLDDDTVCEEFDVFFAITKKQAEKIFVSFYGPKYKSKIDKILSVYTCKNGYYYFGIGDGGFKWATITKYSVDKEGIVTAKVEVKGNETGYKEDDFLIGTFETIFVPNKTSMFGYYIRSFKAEMKSQMFEKTGVQQVSWAGKMSQAYRYKSEGLRYMKAIDGIKTFHVCDGSLEAVDDEMSALPSRPEPLCTRSSKIETIDLLIAARDCYTN